jgi:exosortase
MLGAGLGALLLWEYWPVLTAVVRRWGDDAKYSHGYLVPLFSIWLLWRGRSKLAHPESWVGSWWGLSLLLVAVALHQAGTLFFLDWLSEFSFLPALAGLTCCLGGWTLLRATLLPIAFLGFMFPLPHRLEVALGLPLQNLATQASTFLLQMFGFTVSAEGNVITLSEGSIGVVEACSGLGMLVTFFALATAVAIVVKRPRLDKLVIVASAVPVALIANVIRITATGVLFETLGGRVAMAVYHDWAGLLMVPLALGLLWLELKVWSRVLVEVPATDGVDKNLLKGLIGPTVRSEPSKGSLARL